MDLETEMQIAGHDELLFIIREDEDGQRVEAAKNEIRLRREAIQQASCLYSWERPRTNSN